MTSSCCGCGHVQRNHTIWYGVCMSAGCLCLYFRPQQPTAQGVRAPGGGEALPTQGQNEGTP